MYSNCQRKTTCVTYIHVCGSSSACVDNSDCWRLWSQEAAMRRSMVRYQLRFAAKTVGGRGRGDARYWIFFLNHDPYYEGISWLERGRRGSAKYEIGHGHVLWCHVTVKSNIQHLSLFFTNTLNSQCWQPGRWVGLAAIPQSPLSAQYQIFYYSKFIQFSEWLMFFCKKWPPTETFEGKHYIPDQIRVCVEKRST